MEETRLAAWLEKGFGRAILSLKQTDARHYRDLILHACTHNQTFDRQCEDSRDLFLYDVLTATNDMGYYRRALFAALMDSDEEHDPHQLFGLVRRMAQAGDWEARQCLYAAFDRQAAEEDFRGASEFIALDGLRGFLFITGHYLRCKQAGSLAEGDSDWEWWLSELEERDGIDATQTALRQQMNAVSGLAELMQEAEAKRAESEHKREEHKKNPRPQIMPYAELKAQIHSKGRATSRGTLMTWGRRASEVDLQQAAQDLIAETDVNRVFAYTGIFANRAFPLSTTPLEHSPLLTLARSADVEQAWRATRALGNITHPAVRTLGLQLIAEASRADEGADLLKNNFEESDFALLETALQQPLENTTYHSIGISARHIAEAHLSQRAVPSLLLLYENGPCSLCRHHCVELLLQLDALPASLRAECRYDADEATRKLISTTEQRVRPSQLST